MYDNATITFISESNKETISIVRKCLANSIGIDIRNSNELYFFIHDFAHFNKLQAIFGTEIINESNLNY